MAGFGNLSEQPFEKGQKEAARKVAAAKAKVSSAARAPVRASAPPPAPAKSASPAKSAVSKATLPGSPFGKVPSNALAGAPKLARAYQALPPLKSESSHHSLFSLHTLEEAGSAVGKGVVDMVHAAYGDGRAGTVSEKEFREGKGGVAPGLAVAHPIDSVSIVEGLGKAAENTPKSTVNTITGTIPGLVATGKALAQLAEGHPKEFGEIIKGLGEIAKHPWATFQKEPVPVALMLAGAEGATGRLAGAAMRSGALGDRAAELASMERAPLRIYGRREGGAGLHDPSVPPIEQLRQYSPDVIRKGAQVLVDKFREHHGIDPNVATPAQADRYLVGGGWTAQHTIRKLQGTLKHGLLDEQVAKGEMARRLYTNEAAHVMAELKPTYGADAVPLIVEGIVRHPTTMKADMEKELARLRTKADGLTGEELKLNKRNQKQIQTLLADSKFMADPAPAFHAAHGYIAWAKPRVDELVRLGHMDPDQLNAMLVPYALSHMGPDVRYNLTPGEHPLVAQVKNADRQVKNARKAVERAVKAHDDARVLHPSVPANHPVALAREELRRAELAHAHAEGRSTDLSNPSLPAGERRSPRMLNPVALNGRVPRARAAYDAAKGQLISERHAALQGARNRLSDARGVKEALERDLKDLKDSGAIKSSGEMWPRLEKGGTPLPAEAIREAIERDIGPRGVGFLTHKTDRTFGSEIQSRAGQRPGLENRSRTGVSFDRGGYPRSWKALQLEGYRLANKIAGHENRNALLGRLGIGRYHTEDEARAAADNIAHTPEGDEIGASRVGKLVPVQVAPDRLLSRRQIEMRAFGPVISDFGHTEHKAVEEAADLPKWTLLPERLAERLAKHDALNNRDDFMRGAQWLTNKWRSASLHVNPRWMVGTTQERAIRLLAANINPFALFGFGKVHHLGQDMIDYWHSIMADPARPEAERFLAKGFVGAYQSGGHYGSMMMNAVRRDVKDAPVARGFLEALGDTAPAQAVEKGWLGWRDRLDRALTTLEHNANAAMTGKAALNEARKFTAEWRALITRQDTAVKKFAQGKLSPNEASRFGNDVMEMTGNWSTLTPVVRSLVQGVTPFGLWWLTSMKFVFKALPRDHPMKTAALAAMAAATRDPKAEAETPGYLAGGIKAHLPIVGDVTLTPEYYSPFGIAIEPEKTALDEILPQFSGAYETAHGIDSLRKGALENASREPVDGPHAVAHAAYEFLEGLVPGARQAVQLAQQGGRPEPGSFNPLAVQPGSQRGWAETLAKILSPVRYVAAPRGSSSGPAKLPPGVRERLVRERPVRERPARERPAREG